MLTSITLGPRLSRITGRFNAAERQAIETERRVMISDILSACAESTRQFISAEEYAQMPEHAGKKPSELFFLAQMQGEAFDDHTFTSYAHRMTHPVHMTIDVRQGAEAKPLTGRDKPREGQCLFVELTSENPNFNLSSVLYIDDEGTQKFLHAYWESLQGAPQKGSSVDAIYAFDVARKDVHRASYEVFQTAFFPMGIHAGLKLSTELFGLVATSIPSSRNPMPQMVADAWNLTQGPRF